MWLFIDFDFMKSISIFSQFHLLYTDKWNCPQYTQPLVPCISATCISGRINRAVPKSYYGEKSNIIFEFNKTIVLINYVRLKSWIVSISAHTNRQSQAIYWHHTIWLCLLWVYCASFWITFWKPETFLIGSENWCSTPRMHGMAFLLYHL